MIRIGLGLAACLTFVCPTLSAADRDFHPLFNGKDLSGWVTPENKSLFSVEDGVIVARAKTKADLKKNEFLVTEKSYGDFVLKVKVKIGVGNSGIQFRSQCAENGAVSGPQADVADGWWGTLYEERGRGILEQYDKTKASDLVHKSDWNDFVITAKGDHITIDLNGTRIIDRIDPKFAKSGIIALQLHAGFDNEEVRFKDIEVKTLD